MTKCGRQNANTIVCKRRKNIIILDYWKKNFIPIFANWIKIISTINRHIISIIFKISIFLLQFGNSAGFLSRFLFFLNVKYKRRQIKNRIVYKRRGNIII